MNALCPCPGLGNFSKSDTRVNFVCMGDPGLFLLIYYVTLSRGGGGGRRRNQTQCPPPPLDPHLSLFFIKRIGVMVGEYVKDGGGRVDNIIEGG